METKITILWTGGRAAEVRPVLIVDNPSVIDLQQIVRPILGTAEIEHVSCLYEGAQTDMFVDGDGVAKGLPLNRVATDIYRCAWMTRYPSTDPDTMPAIYGTAVLFGRRVWF